MKYIAAIIVVVVLVIIFVLSYLLNKRVDKPEGCEELNEHCMHCSITSCINNKNKEDKKDV